jgi:hypothetical protein
MNTLVAPAVRPSRIMTPAFDQVATFWIDATRAVIVASPVTF